VAMVPKVVLDLILAILSLEKRFPASTDILKKPSKFAWRAFDIQGAVKFAISCFNKVVFSSCFISKLSFVAMTDRHPPLCMWLRGKQESSHLFKVVFNPTVVGHQTAKQQLIGFSHRGRLVLRLPMAYLAGSNMHVPGKVCL